MSPSKVKPLSWQNRLMPYLVCFSAALFFAYELMQMHMMNAISPFLMRDLNLNATSFGNLCATYLLADVIFLLPAGIILDRFSTRRVILSALFLCLIGTIGFSLAQQFYMVAFFHFLSGIGNAFCFLSCMMLIARWFPAHKQGLIVGLVITIGMLGGVIAQSPFSLLADMLTWRKTLLVDGAVGCAIYFIIYLFVQDGPKTVLSSQNSVGSIGFWDGLKRCVYNRQNTCAGLYTSLMNLPLMVLGAVWGSLFLTQVHTIPLSRASFIVSMICMGTIVGSPLFGYLSDRSQTRKPWMFVGAVLSLVVMLMILFIQHPSEVTLVSLFFLLGLFSSSQILGYPTITESNPPELTGTSMGVAAVIIMGLPMFAQPLSGWLLDLNWTGNLTNGAPLYALSDYVNSFAMFPIGFIIAIIATLLIREKKLIVKSLP